MTAYYIVNCSTDEEYRVQFFSVANEDDYSFTPIGHAYWDDDEGGWSGNFDTKIIWEESIEGLIERIHKRKGYNCDVQFMEFHDFREFIYATCLDGTA